MKRPTGFDRVPELPESQPESPELQPELPELPEQPEIPQAQDTLRRVSEFAGLESAAANETAVAETAPNTPVTPGKVLRSAKISRFAKPATAVKSAQNRKRVKPARPVKTRSFAALWKARLQLAYARQQETAAVRFLRGSLVRLKQRRARRVVAALSVVFGVLLFVGVTLLTPAMAAQKITVVGVKALPAQKVAAALAPLKGKPLVLITEQEVFNALEPFALVQNYSVERLPPNQLRVRIIERTPILAAQKGKKFVLYDAAGVRLQTVAKLPAGVPVVVGKSSLDASSPAFRAVSRVLRQIPTELKAQLVTVAAPAASDITFGLTNGQQLRWGDSENTALKVLVYGKLAAALAGQQITLIDVSSPQAPAFH